MAGIYERVSPGVVFVSARGGNGRLDFQGEGGGQAASGSGFLIDGDGYIVTNDHVVANASEYAVRLGEDGEAIPAKLVGADPSTDLALLKVDPAKLPEGATPLALGSSAELREGLPAVAIGSPFGLEGTVTSGIVSALNRKIQAPERLRDLGRRADRRGHQPRQLGRPAARRRGPRDRRQLADRDGRRATPTAASASRSRSTPSSPSSPSSRPTARSSAPGSASPPARRPTGGGAVVAEVTADGPAAGTGLQPEDRIVKLDGKAVQHAERPRPARPGQAAR